MNGTPEWANDPGVDAPKLVGRDDTARQIIVLCAGGTRQGTNRHHDRHEIVRLAALTSRCTVMELWSLDGPHVRREMVTNDPAILDAMNQHDTPPDLWTIDGRATARLVIDCPLCRVSVPMSGLATTGTVAMSAHGRLSAYADRAAAHGTAAIELSQLGYMLSM